MHLSSLGSYEYLKDTFASLVTNLTAHNASIFAENAKVVACDRMCAPGWAWLTRTDVRVGCVCLTKRFSFLAIYRIMMKLPECLLS
jgi:hypothetical protein